MEIPRGKFLGIKKSEDAGDLVRALVHEKFTGSCTIAYLDTSGCLVFDGGRCILAEYAGSAGDPALDVIQNIPGSSVDAALSVLNPAQIRLCREFNPNAGISLTVSPHTVKPRTAGYLPQPSHPAPLSGKPQSPVLVAGNQKLHVHKSVQMPVPEKLQGRHEGPKASVSHKKPVIRVVPGKLPVIVESVPHEESDLAALDSLNLEKMSGQIRTECRTIVRRLDLEYLMDKD
jgi:hypothetical protein